jgi:hypothetical protein
MASAMRSRVAGGSDPDACRARGIGYVTSRCGEGAAVLPVRQAAVQCGGAPREEMRWLKAAADRD